MNRVPHLLATHRRMAGLSLIEMMIALVMALIVAAGIITVFTSTSSSNKVQVQMAALQEEGRYAIHSLRSDLANANGSYCSNTKGNASVSASGTYLDQLRSPVIDTADLDAVNKAFSDNTTPLAWATPQPFSLPSRMFMRGYDCNTSTCTPAGLDGLAPNIPMMGKGVGARVPGTDVLTIRYLKPGSGWAIVSSGAGSKIDANSDGTVNTITLAKLPDEQPVADFTGSLAMLADCSSAQVFTVTNAGGQLTPNNNVVAPSDNTLSTAPRVFDFDKDFQTVTYFLQVVCADSSSPCDQTTGELVRRVNGTNQPLVRGVERLNFRYGIIGADGLTRFLDADQVDTGSAACHLVPSTTSDVEFPGGMDDSGCLWRAVQTIEVSILMDGQNPLYTLTPGEMNYIYTPDGPTLELPSAHTINPSADQGFPIPLIRRQFTTLVALRNFNP